jgi:hypothetical protein
MPQLEHDPEPFDPHSRRLCPDGSCIGVIGSDGRCKVCGLADRGGGPTLAGLAVEDEPEEELAQPEPSEAPGAGFDPGRKLCVDGSCIGVIGPDGRCGACGRAADS